MYAITLNEILLSCGYKSRMVVCLSADLYDNECHCVVVVFIQNLKKWIMLDPANKSYFVDKNLTPLNLNEIRENLINGKRIYVPNPITGYISKIIPYWCKNLIRFQSYAKSEYNMVSKSGKKQINILHPLSIKINNFSMTDSKKNLLNINIFYNDKIYWEGFN